MDDPIFWMSVTNTIFYTVVATAGKFALGLWLALLLNHHMPFKAFIRAIVLLPWIVPTVLSAIAFWWIYRSAVLDHLLVVVDVLHLRSTYINFLGTPWPARWSLIVANIWRGIPFVAITLLAGLQTISPSLYEAALLDGASGWQKFRRITVPLLMPILAVVLTFSVLFTFSDFQLVYAITRGGPFNTTHLMATLAFQRAIPGAQLGEGAAIAVSMIPFLLGATLLCCFGVGRRKWQQGEAMTDAPSRRRSSSRPNWRRRRPTRSTCPSACRWDSRARRMVTIYLPLALFVIVLLFPFYWMAITAIKPDYEMFDYTKYNPFWIHSPTLAQHQAAVRDRLSALADEHDGGRGRRHLPVDVRQRAGRLCDRAPALQGRAACRPGDLSGLSGAAVDPVHSARHAGLPVRPVRQPAGADPDLSDLPDAVLHLAADRLLQVDPVRAGGMRADRRRVAACRSCGASRCRWRFRA